jgi:hypothetical protein
MSPFSGPNGVHGVCGKYPWRKQPEPPVITAQRMPEPTAEENIARAILDYQRSFSEALRHSETADVAEAKRIVARANEIVGESGLGPALAPKSARIRLG